MLVWGLLLNILVGLLYNFNPFDQLLMNFLEEWYLLSDMLLLGTNYVEALISKYIIIHFVFPVIFITKTHKSHCVLDINNP